MKKLFFDLLSKLDAFLKPIRDKLVQLNKKLDEYFNVSWLVRSMFAKIAAIFAGFVGLVSAIGSLIFAILNVGSLVDVIKGTVLGQDAWLSKLENVLKTYPSFQSLISSMDSQMSALGSYFNPVPTFSKILQVTGIGDGVNSIIVCAVQGVAFVISMRLMFWALGRVKISMVKPIK